MTDIYIYILAPSIAMALVILHAVSSERAGGKQDEQLRDRDQRLW